MTGTEDVVAVAVEAILEDVRRAAFGGEVSNLARAQQIVEDMVPADEGEWTFEMGYGQSAIAAVVYAVRTWLTDDPQEAVWAARQVHQAADYAALKTGQVWH